MGQLYPRPHDHTHWWDHRVRVDVSVAMGLHLLGGEGVIADLSCGDAAIPRGISAAFGGRARLTLGDYAPGHEHVGPIEQTVERVKHADLWVLSETLEHLDDPDAVLRAIRPRTSCLLLSTPDGETDHSNPEHLWCWDSEEVSAMLAAAGFAPIMHNHLDLRPAGCVYAFQIWGCR
jgi:hypothetical protein